MEDVALGWFTPGSPMRFFPSAQKWSIFFTLYYTLLKKTEQRIPYLCIAT